MQLHIYKRGHGYYTRLWSAIACLLLAAIGCYKLHSKLALTGNPWVQNLTPAVVWAAIAWFVYWLSNRPNLADFLIAAEGELKKVSWSSKQQVVSSTIIVIFVVILTSVLLGSVDVLFRLFFDVVVGLYS
jgi:preprotein translocase subunit SecE